MRRTASPRVIAAFGGAVISALVWSGLDELGAWSVLKSELYIGPLAAMIIIGAIAGAIPLLRRALWIAAGATALALAIVSFTPLAGILSRPLVRADALPAEKLDAIVVLSGGATSDSAMSSETVDRLLKGEEAARASGAGALVLSREHFARNGKAVGDSADEANVLALTSVPATVFFIDSATSTHDEALRVRALPVSKGWKRVGVVTSPLHTRRACATFERLGFRVTCIAAVSRERAIRNLDTRADRLHAFRGWFYEMAGTTSYRMKGWI